MEWLDLLTFVAVLPLLTLILLRGFALECKRDEAEGMRNRQDACEYHQWGHVTGGLRCAACGKVPQG